MGLKGFTGERNVPNERGFVFKETPQKNGFGIDQINVKQRRKLLCFVDKPKKRGEGKTAFGENMKTEESSSKQIAAEFVFSTTDN